MTDIADTAIDMASAVSENILGLLEQHKVGLMEIGMDEQNACFKSVMPLIFLLRGYRETVKEFYNEDALTDFDALVEGIKI